MEREGKEKKDHWNWANAALEAHREEIQERISDRSTKRGKGTEDRVDGHREMESSAQES